MFDYVEASKPKKPGGLCPRMTSYTEEALEKLHLDIKGGYFVYKFIVCSGFSKYLIHIFIPIILINFFELFDYGAIARL